jgi:hypothetical protein
VVVVVDWEGAEAVLQGVRREVLHRVVDPVDFHLVDLLGGSVGPEVVRPGRKGRHRVLTDSVVAPLVSQGGPFSAESSDSPLVDTAGGAGEGFGQPTPAAPATVPKTLLVVRRAGSVGRLAGAFPSESTLVGLVGGC